MPYKSDFINGSTVGLPRILEHADIAPLRKGHGHVIHYHHHSVVMNKKRKQAFFSASNIDGATWDPIERSGNFTKDTKNIDPAFQLGDELYKAIGATKIRKNDFDEGHLTSFQEVLWGNENDRLQAGNDTFFFTNCVPQHALLNRGAWKSLEQYITRQGSDERDAKVSVFTGPVLSSTDPFFIKRIDDELIRIPLAFWKVIYYNHDKHLNAVGFMMSHRELLLDEGTVTYDKEDVQAKGITEEDVMMQFPKATTYQVKVELIQQITHLDFDLGGVRLPYRIETPREILYKRIEVERKKAMDMSSARDPLDYELNGLVI